MARGAPSGASESSQIGLSPLQGSLSFPYCPCTLGWRSQTLALEGSTVAGVVKGEVGECGPWSAGHALKEDVRLKRGSYNMVSDE